MTTMLETLNETIAAYTSETRAAKTNGGCFYWTPDGRMCAVGRCMITPECHAFDGKRVGQFAHLDSILKPEYRGFPIEFWVHLQMLHDKEKNWTIDGLSAVGELNAESIRRTIKEREVMV